MCPDFNYGFRSVARATALVATMSHARNMLGSAVPRHEAALRKEHAFLSWCSTPYHWQRRVFVFLFVCAAHHNCILWACMHSCVVPVMPVDKQTTSCVQCASRSEGCFHVPDHHPRFVTSTHQTVDHTDQRTGAAFAYAITHCHSIQNLAGCS